MYKPASLALLALASATAHDHGEMKTAGHTDHGHANNNADSQRLMDANYKRFDETKNDHQKVSFSHCMACMDGLTGLTPNSACFAQGKGGFMRANYARHLRTAFGKVESRVWRENKFVADRWEEADQPEFEGYGTLSWDRVWEKTNPATIDTAVYIQNLTETDPLDASILVGDAGYNYQDIAQNGPSFWNVCVRMTLSSVAPEMVARMPEVLSEVQQAYNGCGEADGACDVDTPVKVHVESAWIENLEAFLPDQLAPVKGLGTKDQFMLVPLMLGVVAMLVVPAFLSFLACTWAEKQKKFEDLHALQEKVIKYMEDSIAAKTSAAEQRSSNVSRYEKVVNDEEEMKRIHRERVYVDPDMDWTKAEEKEE